MYIKTENNLIWDDSNSNCLIRFSNAECQIFAFIQVIDAKSKSAKRYWGLWDHRNEEESLRRIMMNGGAWPDLS